MSREEPRLEEPRLTDKAKAFTKDNWKLILIVALAYVDFLATWLGVVILEAAWEANPFLVWMFEDIIFAQSFALRTSFTAFVVVALDLVRSANADSYNRIANIILSVQLVIMTLHVFWFGWWGLGL